VLKEFRKLIDQAYPNKMLLPRRTCGQGVRPYFGRVTSATWRSTLLMPRMYMAIAQDDRHPLNHGADARHPGHLPWAIFLRNHDELTLRW
jgi:maltose alpha-D-glucosyltransferase/alpha-amylase